MHIARARRSIWKILVRFNRAVLKRNIIASGKQQQQRCLAFKVHFTSIKPARALRPPIYCTCVPAYNC